MTRALPHISVLILLELCLPLATRSQALTRNDETMAWRELQTSDKVTQPTGAGTIALRSLDNIENLIIDEFPGGAVLKGNLLTPEDMRRVKILSSTLDNVFNLCTFHPEALAMAASYIHQILKQNGINGLKLSPLGDSLLMTGTPAEEGDTSKVLRICSSLNIPLIDGTRAIVADSRMILFEVSFVEINKDFFRELGVSWPSSTSLSNPSGMQIGRLEPSLGLEITINHLIHNGDAKIISKPRLACASGQQASFQAGGEIPIPRLDSEGNISVTWKPYGIILDVSPSIESEDNIHVRIHSEVSMVDHANAIEGVPGILTRRVDTYLSLKTGQTVVLSGLVHSDDARNIQKIPVLGNIPIFGELFKSHNFQKRETELVVFLTPLPLTRDPHQEDKQRPEISVPMPGSAPGTE